MTEIPTYCEKCGRTYTTRYDELHQCLILECLRCNYSILTITARDFLALTESQQQMLRRLQERTAEQAGEQEPIIFDPTYASLPLPPCLRSEPDDREAIQVPLQPFNQMMKDFAQAICRAFQIPPLELRTPSLPKGTILSLMPDAVLANGPLLSTPPLLYQPITIKPVQITVNPLSTEDIEKLVQCLKMVRHEAY